MSWDELVAVALIGTDRRPVPVTLPEGAPAVLAERLAARSPEDRLLASAAAWTVARRAGASVDGGAAPPAPAAGDPRPIAPAATLIARLEGDRPELLAEWLELAAARGLRPPPELVPELLDLAAYATTLHAAVAEAAGPLGRWLAERNPRWAFVRGATGDAEAIWADGEPAERRALLEQLRRSDPAAARELLASTFADEAWEDRAAFVDVLATGLSDADEPFLEAALDDRRRAVRDAAAALLARLPASRFAARMAARAAPLLRVEDGRLVAALPGEPDAAAIRDGVPAGGSRADRLTAILAAAPLATWPLEWAALPVADDLAAWVRGGWDRAAVDQRDAEWALALWAERFVPELLLALPRAEAERLAARAPLPDLAGQIFPTPWGRELSKAAIDAIHARRSNQLRGHDVDPAGYLLDPSFEDEVEERLRPLGGRDIRILCDVLAARAAMLRELT